MSAEEFDGLTIEQLAAELDDDWSPEALADRDGGRDMVSPAIVNWRDIDDEDREEACRALAEWVQDWLVPRYALTRKVVPDCWYRHPAMVEELSALHTAWMVAFDETDAGYGPIGWHERFALARAREAFREKCAEGHRDERSPRTMPEAPDTF